MRVTNNNQNTTNDYCVIQNLEWFENQKISGKIVAKSLQMCEDLAKSFSCLEISKKIEEFILDNNCVPTFKNYEGFPEALCVSINNELVHGIPKNIHLKEGDVVSFDVGATYNGAIADAAITIIVGENKKAKHLVETTKLALMESIKQISTNSRLGIIGETIYKVGSRNNLQVVNKYGGHFLDINKPHASPFISNKDNKQNGIRFQNGMSFAIEPLFCLGFSNETKTLEDKWTVVTNDLSAHFEHTIFIKDDKPIIMTEI